MRVKILGSAAGGGFRNGIVLCSNCRPVRAGTFHGKPRTQTQIAITQDRRSWFLLGCVPRFAGANRSYARVASARGLAPVADRGVVLASADLDHILGLLLLRELQPLRVHATASVRRILREDNSDVRHAASYSRPS